MIAALGLLFLDEEATFWYMVAIFEKILPSDYYSCGLVGAQADQASLGYVRVRQAWAMLGSGLGYVRIRQAWAMLGSGLGYVRVRPGLC